MHSILRRPRAMNYLFDNISRNRKIKKNHSFTNGGPYEILLLFHSSISQHKHTNITAIFSGVDACIAFLSLQKEKKMLEWKRLNEQAYCTIEVCMKQNQMRNYYAEYASDM